MDWNIRYMTENDCYKQGRKLTPKGIMVHSTASPGVMAAKWYDRWNKAGVEKCVHAFVDNRETVQYLPWEMRGWHAGGAANNTHIGFEICEDKGWSEAYFLAAWDNAVVLAAHLCGIYGLTERQILSHREGHAQGIASNHGDPDHWWGKFGKTMDAFRVAVAQKLEGAQPAEPLYTRQVNTPGDTLNVRGAANAKGDKLGELAHGSTVEAYGLADNGWVLIQQGSLRGWVNGKYLVEPEKTFEPYIVRVTAGALNIRKGPGTNYDVAGCIRDKGSYTIVDEQDGWGRLKSGAGWISLAYTTKAGDAGTKPELTRILKLASPNMRGEDVRWAQQRLNELGYGCGKADGIFGQGTDKAVKTFQGANGLSQDGDIGPKTWAKL